MAGPVTEALIHTTTASASAPPDPVIQSLVWVGGVIAAVIALGVPIRNYIRDSKREDKTDVATDAKTSAETVLYTHLADQVKQYRIIADRAFAERNALVERVAALEAKAGDLAQARIDVNTLKGKLDAKDTQIRDLLAQAADERRQFLAILQSKDADIARRDERITALENRQRELEIRLAQDESSMSVQCPFHDKVTSQSIDMTGTGSVFLVPKPKQTT